MKPFMILAVSLALTVISTESFAELSDPGEQNNCNYEVPLCNYGGIQVPCVQMKVVCAGNVKYESVTQISIHKNTLLATLVNAQGVSKTVDISGCIIAP